MTAVFLTNDNSLIPDFKSVKLSELLGKKIFDVIKKGETYKYYVVLVKSKEEDSDLWSIQEIGSYDDEKKKKYEGEFQIDETKEKEEKPKKEDSDEEEEVKHKKKPQKEISDSDEEDDPKKSKITVTKIENYLKEDEDSNDDVPELIGSFEEECQKDSIQLKKNGEIKNDGFTLEDIKKMIKEAVNEKDKEYQTKITELHIELSRVKSLIENLRDENSVKMDGFKTHIDENYSQILELKSFTSQTDENFCKIVGIIAGLKYSLGATEGMIKIGIPKVNTKKEEEEKLAEEDSEDSDESEYELSVKKESPEKKKLIDYAIEMSKSAGEEKTKEIFQKRKTSISKKDKE